MPTYTIFRLRQSLHQQFRWAPHTSGATEVRPKDYEAAGQIEAPSPYAAWSRLREEGRPLRVGDLLECVKGELRICKYVGFEEAHWVLPETRADQGNPSAGAPSEPLPPQPR